jgi:hypothetical protein
MGLISENKYYVENIFSEEIWEEEDLAVAYEHIKKEEKELENKKANDKNS